MILPNAIDSPFISHLEQKNEKVKFLRIDADVNETFKEKEEDDEAQRSRQRRTQKAFQRSLRRPLETISWK